MCVCEREGAIRAAAAVKQHTGRYARQTGNTSNAGAARGAARQHRRAGGQAGKAGGQTFWWTCPPSQARLYEIQLNSTVYKSQVLLLYTYVNII